MLPSISSGRYGIVSEPVYSPNSVHEINEVNNPLPDSFVDKDQTWPSLPLISEGSFTSLVSKQSGKSLERGRERTTKNKKVSGFKTQLHQYKQLVLYGVVCLSPSSVVIIILYRAPRV